MVLAGKTAPYLRSRRVHRGGGLSCVRPGRSGSWGTSVHRGQSAARTALASVRATAACNGSGTVERTLVAASAECARSSHCFGGSGSSRERRPRTARERRGLAPRTPAVPSPADRRAVGSLQIRVASASALAGRIRKRSMGIQSDAPRRGGLDARIGRLGVCDAVQRDPRRPARGSLSDDSSVAQPTSPVSVRNGSSC